MKRGGSYRQQRGVALIIALVLMALATILAVKIGFGGFIERKRTTSMLAAEQAFQFALGAEALAADVLSRSTTPQTTLADPWAQAPQPIPLRPPNDPEGEPMGTLEGYLEDETGKFNINSLLSITSDGKQDPVPLAQFENLLATLNINSKWAPLARDWVDPDSNVSFPNGAEDAVYSAQTPPYHTSNWPMLSTTELMSLPGFGIEQYQTLAPYITALPTTKLRINVCTAPGKLLDALTGRREFGADPDILIKGRKAGCFPTIAGLTADMAPDLAAKVKNNLSETSDYFRLTTRVTLGSTEFTLYSLLYRKQTRVTPILRSFGTQ